MADNFTSRTKQQNSTIFNSHGKAKTKWIKISLLYQVFNDW